MEVLEIDWGSNAMMKMQRTYDVIIGADIVYIEETFDDLLKTLKHFSNGNTVLYLASKIRYERDNRFYKLLSEQFSVEEVYFDKEKDMHIFEAHLL